jgi:hypothetical protein
VQLETILALVVGGAVGGGITTFLYVYRRKPREGRIARSILPETLPLSKDRFEKSKREMNTLHLEKELLSGALTRLYEAETVGKITKSERDTLSAKYREQIHAIDNKLVEIEAVVEAGELQAVREEIVSILQTKISQIEARLSKVMSKVTPSGPAIQAPEEPIKVEEVVEKRPVKVREEVEAERKVRALRDEVLEALARLEQMDIDSG